MRAVVFLAGMRAQYNGVDGRILLGDNTSSDGARGHAVADQVAVRWGLDFN